jgi:hypothetical protein
MADPAGPDRTEVPVPSGWWTRTLPTTAIIPATGTLYLLFGSSSHITVQVE